jgi:hypothetical protein
MSKHFFPAGQGDELTTNRFHHQPLKRKKHPLKKNNTNQKIALSSCAKCQLFIVHIFYFKPVTKSILQILINVNKQICKFILLVIQFLESILCNRKNNSILGNLFSKVISLPPQWSCSIII